MTTFAALQREYRLHHIALYPVKPESKMPAIRGYARVGLAGSAQLAEKFADALAAGFVAGARNRVTIVDLDTPDERLAEDVRARFGVTPLSATTPSGGRHYYYRHNGEARRIRPMENVDLLGAGNVVAAGSIVQAGEYRLERGTLEDLDRLPTIRPGALSGFGLGAPAGMGRIPIGRRNDALFKHCLRHAPACDSLDDLFDVAASFNDSAMTVPEPSPNVVATARSAWAYQRTGRNLVGKGGGVFVTRAESADLLREPDVLALIVLLRLQHLMGGKTFAISPKAMASTRSIPGWTDPRRYRRARDGAIQLGLVEQVHAGGSGAGDPSLFRLMQPR